METLTSSSSIKADPRHPLATTNADHSETSLRLTTPELFIFLREIHSEQRSTIMVEMPLLQVLQVLAATRTQSAKRPCNPILGAIHNPILAVLGLDGSGL